MKSGPHPRLRRCPHPPNPAALGVPLPRGERGEGGRRGKSLRQDDFRFGEAGGQLCEPAIEAHEGRAALGAAEVEGKAVEAMNLVAAR